MNTYKQKHLEKVSFFIFHIIFASFTYKFFALNSCSARICFYTYEGKKHWSKIYVYNCLEQQSWIQTWWRQFFIKKYCLVFDMHYSFVLLLNDGIGIGILYEWVVNITVLCLRSVWMPSIVHKMSLIPSEWLGVWIVFVFYGWFRIIL